MWVYTQACVLPRTVAVARIVSLLIPQTPDRKNNTQNNSVQDRDHTDKALRNLENWPQCWVGQVYSPSGGGIGGKVGVGRVGNLETGMVCSLDHFQNELIYENFMTSWFWNLWTWKSVILGLCFCYDKPYDFFTTINHWNLLLISPKPLLQMLLIRFFVQ